MAAGTDLIGPKQAPSGDIVGLDNRAGDTYHPSGFGPVVVAEDGTYWRFAVNKVDNGDGTFSYVPSVTQLILT